MTFRAALLFTWLVACFGAPLQAEGDPDGQRNQAGSSELPDGDGIAAAFPGQANIANHPNVIFAENFETEMSLIVGRINR